MIYSTAKVIQKSYRAVINIRIALRFIEIYFFFLIQIDQKKLKNDKKSSEIGEFFVPLLPV